MVPIYVFAFDRYRRSNFERFWYFHHLFILYYALSIVHGLLALFGTAQFWMFAIPALGIYGLDRLIRALRSVRAVNIVKVGGYF